ncbi:UvrD-helicase domain-containing protein [Amycolatopsis thailandensis]|uniref:UvrD-helicase domain-containing protein n=1 Tax=Amycolatopsis thailandensis TaxID=589330 RepID=UPI00364DE840
MTDADLAGSLTPEQQAVVSQPADAMTLVTAGPGTGKTHTLIRRLDTLVSDELNAGEILVLTFSRAAVRELRRKIVERDSATRFVRAYTFDAWALDLLITLDGDGAWHGRPFEERIRKATELIEEGEADEYCDGIRHVAVDEVQDLVGPRRRMVEAVLHRFACGFTVVGDPAQAIYGFQTENPAERSVETGSFFRNLKLFFGDNLVELELTRNFRVRRETAEYALRFGAGLRTYREDAETSLRNLTSALRAAPDFGPLDDEYARTVLSQPDTTTAILCRTNGNALLITELLSSAGISHRLQRSATERIVPKWIGQLFIFHKENILSANSFRDISGDLTLPTGADPDSMWRSLLRAAGGNVRNRVVRLTDIRRAVSRKSFPDELLDEQDAPLTVSSFHRSKGLEFDRVLVASPTRKRALDRHDTAEEARTLYVAMTRARDLVMRIDIPDTGAPLERDGKDGRWLRRRWHNRQCVAFEADGRDVASLLPPGTEDFIDDPASLQEYLSGKVLPGDEVSLVKAHDLPLGERESPPYLVVHADRPVATTSKRFREAMHRYALREFGRVTRWPTRITGIRVDTIEAVAGSEAAGAAAGLGRGGVWLIPRLSGLGNIVHGPSPTRGNS